MIVHGFVDDKHIKKEKAKAKALRKSSWWKKKLAEGICHYCQNSFDQKDLTMDHKTPISRGGTSTKGNLVVACKACNSEKKYYTPAELILKKQAAEKDDSTIS
jgi:5-methylcytosine-specific restriction protein A